MCVEMRTVLPLATHIPRFPVPPAPRELSGARLYGDSVAHVDREITPPNQTSSFDTLPKLPSHDELPGMYRRMPTTDSQQVASSSTHFAGSTEPVGVLESVMLPPGSVQQDASFGSRTAASTSRWPASRALDPYDDSLQPRSVASGKPYMHSMRSVPSMDAKCRQGPSCSYWEGEDAGRGELEADDVAAVQPRPLSQRLQQRVSRHQNASSSLVHASHSSLSSDVH